jgi:hypothetical protein
VPAWNGGDLNPTTRVACNVWRPDSGVYGSSPFISPKPAVRRALRPARTCVEAVWPIPRPVRVLFYLRVCGFEAASRQIPRRCGIPCHAWSGGLAPPPPACSPEVLRPECYLHQLHYRRQLLLRPARDDQSLTSARCVCPGGPALCGRRESNPRPRLGRPLCCHNTSST